MYLKWESEKELALVVIQHLKLSNWIIYPEINGIDIVAVKDKDIIGIECKKHFNLTVLNQAYKNRKFLNQTWIAATSGWKNNEDFGLHISKQNNIGVFFVNKRSGFNRELLKPEIKYEVYESFVPEKEEIKDDSIKKLIHPNAENYAEAGQSGGKHWTTFTLTVFKLKEYVEKNPGCKMSEAIKNIDHHYSNNNAASSNLNGYIKDQIIKDIIIKDKKLYIKPVC